MTAPYSHDPADLLGDQRWLAGLVRGLVEDEHAVEDVLQETRIRVWRHPSPDPERARGWLRRIASNVAHSMRSSDSARRVRERQSARPEHTASTDELVARADMQRAVAEAVVALAEPYRTAILLRFFDGLPPRAIAERLGVPVETVRTRLKRGLAQLRAELDGHYGTRAAWSALMAPGVGWTAGATAMGSGAKLAIGAAVLAVLGLATWMTRPDATGSSAPPPSLAAEPELVLPGAERGQATVEPDALERGRTIAGRSASSALAARARILGSVVDASTLRPVAGARVTLTYRGEGSTPLEVESVTAGDGTFEAFATDASQASFSGRVAHPDYASVQLEHLQSAVDLRFTKRADGGLEANVGVIPMHVGTLVSGRVVRLPDRSPVSGAELLVLDRLQLPHGVSGLDAAQSAGRSRGDGTFELDRRVVAENGPLAIFAVSNGRIGFALIQPERARDRVEDFEITIEPPGSLLVRVVDDRGTPVANVALTAHPTFAPFWQHDYGRGPGSMPELRDERWIALFMRTTDASGRAHFAELPEGRGDALLGNSAGHVQSYAVHASAPGWPDAREGALIARGVESTLEIRLKPACTWRVVGRVVGEDGRPIAGARVTVQGQVAESESDGRYATPVVPGGLGNVDIVVTSAGHSPDEFRATRSWVREKLVTRRDGPVPCEELEHDVTLAAARTVRGRVVDAVGRPVAGVAIKAEGFEPGRQNWTSLEMVGGSTGTDGTFVIEGVTFDGLALSVNPPDDYLSPFPVRIAAPDERTIVTVLAKPTPTCQVVATVRDAATNELLEPSRAYARALSSRGTGMPSARCSLGRVVADGLYPGSWELRVELRDGRGASRRFEIEREHQMVELAISVGARGIVEGWLFDSNGERFRPPKDRWWVWVRPASQSSGDSGHAIDADGRPISGLTDGCAQFDEEGRFRIGRLPAGVPIRFVVEGKSTCADVTVELVSGETRRVEFHLRPTADVQWQLAQPLGPGQVAIETASGDEPLATLFAAPTGVVGTALSRQKMPAGRVRWRAEFTSSSEYPPRRLVASGEAQLAPGGLAIVDVTGFE